MLTSGTSHDIKNLSVKKFNGKVHLGTTVPTTFNEIEAIVDDTKGKDLLANVKKTITVSEFKFCDKVNSFLICQIPTCKKKMPYAVEKQVTTCTTCGTCQKVFTKKVQQHTFQLKSMPKTHGSQPLLSSWMR